MIENLKTILLVSFLSLTLLAVLVIWVIILATTWVYASKFTEQYRESKRELARKEEQAKIIEAQAALDSDI